ncbi:MAG: tetratricopeptide repeat protein, partial [Rubripirellula sp.]
MRNKSPVSIILAWMLVIWGGCQDSDPSPTTPVNKKTDLNQRGANSARTEDLFVKSVTAYRRRDFPAANQAIREHLLVSPDDLRGMEMLGDIAASMGDDRLANESYGEVLRRSESPTEAFLSKYAMRLMASSRAYDCLGVLRTRAAKYPGHPEAGPEMAGLAAMLGVAEQGVDALRQFARRGGADPETLQVLADPRRVEPDIEMCERLLAKNPEDLRPQFALARAEANELSWSKVKTRLQPVVQRHPDFLPGQMLYGLALVQQGEFAALPEWHQSVPASARTFPDYWMVAGSWAKHEKKYDEAARAFWEAVRLDSSGYPEALPNLLFALKQLKRDNEANEVAS